MRQKQSAAPDPISVFLEGIETQTTRESYERYFKQLAAHMNLTGFEMLDEMRKDLPSFWVRAKAAATRIKSPGGRTLALYALRTFIRSYGLFPPSDRIKRAKPVKSEVYLEWDEAMQIVSHAGNPYKQVFTLMLHSVWGCHEFFQFNTQENWAILLDFMEKNPEAPYYRYNQPGRKGARLPFYSLIPMKLIRDFIKEEIRLPITTPRGAPLDLRNYRTYRNSLIYLETGFNTALVRSAIKKDVSVHELRDTFKTKATKKDVRIEVEEFLMGHNVDARGYEKCWNDQPWMEEQINKMEL